MPLSIPGAPAPVTEALHELINTLSRRLGPCFEGLIVYGGLARGRFVPGRSDVNVMLLLSRCDGEVLQQLAPALREARRAVAAEPLLMVSHELALAARDFPTKFLDIQQHHRVLHGGESVAQRIAALQIPTALVRQRVAQSLRNQVMRLRQRYLTHFDDDAALQTALAQNARPLSLDLAALLQLGGHALPAEDRTAALFAAAASTLDLDGPTLAALAALRNGTPPAEVVPLYEAVLVLVARLADHCDALAGAS